MVAGSVADRIGRRSTLLAAGLIFLVGAIVSALTPNETILLVGRFVVGIGIGFSSVVAPLYISEVAPASSRGALVSLYQFAITVGILAAYLIDFALASGGQWRWMLGLAVIPSLVLIGGMIVDAGEPALSFQDRVRRPRARGAGNASTTIRKRRIEQEAQSILYSLQVRSARASRPSRSRRVRLALFIGISLAVLQQITGINTVIYYGPQIFQMAGIASASASIFAQTLVGTVNCSMTLVAIFFVDRIGRKPLLYAGLPECSSRSRRSRSRFRAPHLSGVAWHDRAREHDALRRLLCLQPRSDRLAAHLGDLSASGARPRHVALDARQLGRQLSRLAVLSDDGRATGRPATFWIYAALCIVTILFVRSMVPETKRAARAHSRHSGRCKCHPGEARSA